MNDRHPASSYVAPVFRVSDLARSIRFYSEQPGVELDFSYENFYASMHRDGCYIHLKFAAAQARDQAAFEHAEHLGAPLSALIAVIVLFHLFLNPQGIPLAVVLLVCAALLYVAYARRYASLFAPGNP